MYVIMVYGISATNQFILLKMRTLYCGF